MQVTFTADATFFGIDPAHGSASLNITPASIYTIRSSSALSLSKYLLYLVPMAVLIAVNVALVVLGRRAIKGVAKDGK
jgi:hypothetical protein